MYDVVEKFWEYIADADDKKSQVLINIINELKR